MLQDEPDVDWEDYRDWRETPTTACPFSSMQIPVWTHIYSLSLVYLTAILTSKLPVNRLPLVVEDKDDTKLCANT